MSTSLDRSKRYMPAWETAGTNTPDVTRSGTVRLSIDQSTPAIRNDARAMSTLHAIRSHEFNASTSGKGRQRTACAHARHGPTRRLALSLNLGDPMRISIIPFSFWETRTAFNRHRLLDLPDDWHQRRDMGIPRFTASGTRLRSNTFAMGRSVYPAAPARAIAPWIWSSAIRDRPGRYRDGTIAARRRWIIGRCSKFSVAGDLSRSPL